LTLDIECQNIEGSIIKIDWGVIMMTVLVPIHSSQYCKLCLLW